MLSKLTPPQKENTTLFKQLLRTHDNVMDCLKKIQGGPKNITNLEQCIFEHIRYEMKHNAPHKTLTELQDYHWSLEDICVKYKL